MSNVAICSTLREILLLGEVIKNCGCCWHFHQDSHDFEEPSLAGPKELWGKLDPRSVHFHGFSCLQYCNFRTGIK